MVAAPAFITNFLEKRKFKKTMDDFVEIMHHIPRMNEVVIESAIFFKKEFKLYATREEYKAKLKNVLVLHSENIKKLNQLIIFGRDFMQKNKFSDAERKKYEKILEIAEKIRDQAIEIIEKLLIATPTPKAKTPSLKKCVGKKKTNCKSPCSWIKGKGCK